MLEGLRELGNTVVVVEHDLDVIRSANHLIDIGPEAGENGGQILYAGTPDDLKKNPGDSLTGAYLNEKPTTPPKKKPVNKKKTLSRHGRREPSGWITIEGAQENNLKGVTAQIPLGVLCCVTGVSGSGKSSLIKACLYENYRRLYKGESQAEPGEILNLTGADVIDDIVMIDQSPIGRSSRSNAATYLKAYDQIRSLLASTPDGKALGLLPRDFSFNVPGGRCETCEGTGTQTIDMHFLSDVEVVCEICDGKRFQERILDVEWNGKNITGILDLTVHEALDFFADHRRIISGLEPLARVGLGYLRLGQSTATLSGGEAQRLKLASHLADTSSKGNSLLLFDEPTTGLHASDLDTLMKVFDDLLEKGFSLVIIEHNLQLIRRADYIIDIGPEGGDEGGQIVCEGTPEDVAIHPDSITGKFILDDGGRAARNKRS